MIFTSSHIEHDINDDDTDDANAYVHYRWIHLSNNWWSHRLDLRISPTARFFVDNDFLIYNTDLISTIYPSLPSCRFVAKFFLETGSAYYCYVIKVCVSKYKNTLDWRVHVPNTHLSLISLMTYDIDTQTPWLFKEIQQTTREV